MSALLEKALALNLPVFPCHPNKCPATPHGFHDAVIEPQGIRSFDWHNRLIGVPTGLASGIDVLDIDNRNGGGDWYAANKARLPATRIQRTRSGGLHLLFAAHPQMKCSAGKIAPGVDVRAQGGYTIWWAAEGLPYRDYPPSGLSAWPEWLLRAAMPEPAPQARDLSPIGDWRKRPARENIRDLRAFERLLKFVANAPKGERISRLYWAACRVDEFVMRDLVSSRLGFDELERAAAYAGLPMREISSTITSALRGLCNG
jgi:hypothetical protein